MSARIFWTSEAEKTFQENLQYLSKEWDANVITNFLDRVDEAILLIGSNPRLYQYHNLNENIRRCVIHERIVLFYKIVNDEEIHLLTFWNTSKDPATVKF